VTRAALDYRERRASAHAVGGYEAETPTAGYYRMKLVSGGHPVGVWIFYGPPRDPVTGQDLDRSWRWQARVNGEDVDLSRVWPQCGREPITQVEHDYLASLQAWAAEHAPSSPAADPRRKIDLLSSPMPF
jgi:hypothetical protein